MNQTVKQQKGFTIIEVVLVLAIAGLIFLMIFIALPALQRTQRDTARKDNISKVLAGISNYRSNNNNKNPSIGESFAKYLDGTYDSATGISIDGGNYTVVSSGDAAAKSKATKDTMAIEFGAKCDDAAGDGATTDATTAQAAIVMQLENADAYYCQDNS